MRRKFVIYLFILVIVIVLLSGCRYYFGGNYPQLYISDYGTDYEEIREKDEKSGETERIRYKYTLTINIENHGMPGKMKMKYKLNKELKWSEFGNIYIKDKYGPKEFIWGPYDEPIDFSGKLVLYSVKNNGSLVRQEEIDF